MTPDQLSHIVLAAVHRAVESGELARVAVPERLALRRPSGPDDGDYSTGVALALAKAAGRSAREVAEVLRARLCEAPGVARVRVAGPGFLNITVDGAARARLVRQLMDEDARSRAPGACPQADAGGPVSWARAERPASAMPVASRTAAGGDPDSAGGEATPHGAHPAAPARTPSRGAEPHAPVADVEPHDPLRDAERWATATGAVPADTAVDGGTSAAGLAPLLAQRESNPLFRVQYAHARTQALRRNAHDLGFAADPDGAAYDAPVETELLALLADHERVRALARTDGSGKPRERGRTGDTGRLARHLVAVADAFLRFHGACRVLPVGDEKPEAAHRARLALAQATGTVLAGGLTQLGITAPARL